MKRILSLILALVLAVSLVPSAFAASNEAMQAANALHELGLFNGTGTDASGKPNFELDRSPDRHKAVTMLVRLLGKEQEAKSGSWNTPFTDVAEWAKPYVGYAYTKGLTTGTSATSYGGDEAVTASQYLTFVLRALNYTSGTDFQWDKAWDLSDKIGLTKGNYTANIQDFNRGDVAIVSYRALDTKLKGSTKILRNTLSLPIPATSISLDKTKATLVLGDTLQLTATILPSNANTNNTIAWTSSSPSIASVDSSGKVTINRTGYATITATLPDKKTKATCFISVERTKIVLRDSLPKTLSYYGYHDEIQQQWSVYDFWYELKYSGTTAYFYLSGTKIYDIKGPGQGANCRIGWQLYDKDGFVVDSGTMYSPSVRMGEKFKDAKGYLSDLGSGTYYLELSSTN